MARGRKTGGRDFKKGQSGNPKGRPPMPEDLRQIKKLSPALIRNIIAKLSRMSRIELEKHIKQSTTPMLEATIGNVYHKALVNGDYMRMNFLLDRTIGKVKDEIDMNLKPVITYKTTMSDDGRMLQDVIEGELVGETGTDGSN